MFKKLFKFLFIFILFNFNHAIKAIFPINFFRAFDINFRTERWKDEKYEGYIIPEFAFDAKGRNNHSNEVNILQIWNCTQDALAMVRGFDPNSDIGRFALQLNDVTDDGTRGHFLPSAKLNVFDVSFTPKFYLPHDFSIYLYIPFFSMQLKDVCFKDLTEDVLFIDQEVKTKLTNNICNVTKELGCLELNGWKKSGPGDFIATLEWARTYAQTKPLLKNVGVSARVGGVFPSGVKKNEDQLLSIPFGYDGAFGLLFGGGIDLTWGKYLRSGIDVEFLQLFGNTKERRIKTDIDQTELLLLAKTKVFKEQGILQRFNIYTEAYKFLKGLSFRVTYQYYKQNEDKLWLLTNDYSNFIANSAESLQGWSIHQLLFILDYDPLKNYCDSHSWLPRCFLYYKLPFNGTRSIGLHSAGFAFSLSF